MAERDNSVTITGNLTDTPELRFTEAGLAVARMSVAVNRGRKMPDGSFEDEAHFFNVTAFGDLADNVSHLDKGTRITVFGRLEQRRWDDKDTGEPRSMVAIVADDIAPSLRWATAAVTKNAKGGGAKGSSSTAEDPWA